MIWSCGQQNQSRENEFFLDSTKRSTKRTQKILQRELKRVQNWIVYFALQDPRHVRREIFRKGDPRFHRRESPEKFGKGPLNGPKSPRRLLGLASHVPDEGEFVSQRNSSNPVLSKKVSASRNLLWESPLDFVGDLFNKVRQRVVLGCDQWYLALMLTESAFKW